jgi:hypothetical protein
LTYQITTGALFNGDTLTGALTRLAGETIGAYAVQQGTLAATTNYTLTYVGTNLTITPRPLTVTADAQTKVYGDSDPALTYQLTSGTLIGGDGFSGALSRVAGGNVGAYAIQQNTLTAGTNYAITYIGADLTITQRPLGVTADARTKVYGDADPALTYQLTSGTLIGSDSFSGALTRVAGENVGSYAILQGTLTAGANYSLGYTGANVTITPRSLLAQADDKTRAYGVTNPVLTITFTGFAFSDTPTNLAELPVVSTTADTNSPVGTYDITLSGGSDTNYSLTLSNGTLTVTAYALTLTANNQSRAYGATNPPLTGTLTGVQNGDNITASYSTTADTTSPIGDYTILASLNDPDNKLTNYSVTLSNGTLSVTSAVLTVTADAQTKVYGGTDPALTYQITTGALVNGDTLTGALTRVAGETIGSYAIQQGTLTSTTNYALTFVGADLTITPRALAVTADAQTKVYGDADPALTYQLTSGALVGSDSFSGALTRVAGENVGTYAILQGTLTAGTNYTLSYTGADLTITQRAIAVTADAKSKVYGDADPALTYQLTSGTLVGSDSFSGALTRVAGENVGAYAILQGTLTAGANYSLSYTGANLTITLRPLLARADDQSRPYGATNPVLTITFTGFAGGDGPMNLAELPVPSTTADTSSPIGQYEITLTGGSDTNYSLTLSNGTLSVTSAVLIVTADAQTKPYGDTDPALTYQITTGALFNGDTLTGALTRVAGETVGIYAIQQGTLAATTNYALTYVGANLTITPRALTVTADAQTKVYGTADPALTYQLTSGTLVGSDSFSGALTRVAGENAGTYAILQGTLTAGTNYAINYIGANLTLTAGNSALAVASSANPSPTGSNVTFTATLSAVSPAVGTPTGAVQFKVDGSAFGSPATLTGGVASLTTSALSHGYHTIAACYPGDGNFHGSTNSLGTNELINTSPVAINDTLATVQNTAVNMSGSKLSKRCTDADADALHVSAVSPESSQGGTVSLSGNTITYNPPMGYVGADVFTYAVSDTFGGYGIGTIYVTVRSANVSPVITSITQQSDGNFQVKASGIPGATYNIQASSDLSSWGTIGSTVATTNGIIIYLDQTATNYPSRFYRTAAP